MIGSEPAVWKYYIILKKRMVGRTICQGINSMSYIVSHVIPGSWILSRKVKYVAYIKMKISMKIKDPLI